MGFLVQWASLVLIWMLLISKWDPTEFCAGLLAGSIAVVASRMACSERHFAFVADRSPPLKAGWRLPGYMVSGTFEVMKGLGRQIFTREGATSRIRAVSFEVGSDEPRDRARRALAIALTSATPNSVVIGIDHESQNLLFHQVVPGPVRKMTRELGAGKASP